MSREIIAILCRPNAGKSTLAQKLSKEKNYPILHTDKYIGDVDFKDVPKRIIEDLEKDTQDGGIIVEGIQAARLVRTGQRDKSFTPSEVYWVDSNLHLEKRHRSLDALCRNCITEFEDNNETNIPVHRVFNDLGGVE